MRRSLPDTFNRTPQNVLEPSAFFRPAGSDAADQSESIVASAEEVAAARQWCEDHADELDDIFKLDEIQVNINEDGFGTAGGYGEPPYLDNPYE